MSPMEANSRRSPEIPPIAKQNSFEDCLQSIFSEGVVPRHPPRFCLEGSRPSLFSRGSFPYLLP